MLIFSNLGCIIKNKTSLKNHLSCAASQQMGFGNALKTYPASVIEFGISGLGAIAVSGLACMHTWLIATMQTTNEDVRCYANF